MWKNLNQSTYSVNMEPRKPILSLDENIGDGLSVLGRVGHVRTGIKGNGFYGRILILDPSPVSESVLSSAIMLALNELKINMSDVLVMNSSEAIEKGIFSLKDVPKNQTLIIEDIAEFIRRRNENKPHRVKNSGIDDAEEVKKAEHPFKKFFDKNKSVKKF